MPEPPDLEARVTALETEVRQLSDRVRHSEQDAAAARVLAGGADRDVAEIRTDIREFRDQNNRILNAMREDVTDLRTDLTDLRRKVDTGFQRMDFEFQKVDSGFVEMRGRLDATAAGLQQVTDMLTTLITPARRTAERPVASALRPRLLPSNSDRSPTWWPRSSPSGAFSGTCGSPPR